MEEVMVDVTATVTAEAVVTPGTVQKTRELAVQNTRELAALREDMRNLKGLLEGELLGMGETGPKNAKALDYDSGCLASEVATQTRLIREVRRLVHEVTKRVDDRVAMAAQIKPPYTAIPESAKKTENDFRGSTPSIGDPGYRVGRVGSVSSVIGDPYHSESLVTGGSINFGGER
jgi:hypothetical protein